MDFAKKGLDMVGEDAVLDVVADQLHGSLGKIKDGSLTVDDLEKNMNGALAKSGKPVTVPRVAVEKIHEKLKSDEAQSASKEDIKKAMKEAMSMDTGKMQGMLKGKFGF
eukprot:TRINITY_DN6204_c0_g1_i1.p2 TRINITY_DN6204_c0_g1~~TRINITY_DN6204_c0_g1_i1.p2  ORF type:complete len:109 (+),score=51.89 TRINITY_DN6204_c0_g1_i1:218-544(+)